MPLTIGWLTAFIDLPAPSFEATAAFWLAATESTLSSRRGATGQFATLVPDNGDAYLRVQRVDDGPGGCHLDIHVGDIASSIGLAVELGATATELDGVTVAQSPGGMTFCIVGHCGESTRPHPVGSAGARSIADQLSIDVPPAAFDRECEFWAALTGWETMSSPARPEFTVLARPAGMPLRLLLQRLDSARQGQAAAAHLDLACDDRDVTAYNHVALGAAVAKRHEYWTAMADPTGLPYCLTRRNPDTGQLV